MDLIIRKPIVNSKGEQIAYSSKEVSIPLGNKARRLQEDILVDIKAAAELFAAVDRECGGFDPVKQIEDMALDKLQEYEALKRYKEFMLGWFGYCQTTEEGRAFVDKITAEFNMSAEKKEIDARMKRK